MTKETMRKVLREKDYDILFMNDKMDRIELASPNYFDEVYYLEFIKNFPSSAWLVFKEQYISKDYLTGRQYKLIIRLKDSIKILNDNQLKEDSLIELKEFFEKLKIPANCVVGGRA
jgi:hypothetical protein